jgi:hypothetical protein
LGDFVKTLDACPVLTFIDVRADKAVDFQWMETKIAVAFIGDEFLANAAAGDDSFSISS